MARPGIEPQSPGPGHANLGMSTAMGDGKH